MSATPTQAHIFIFEWQRSGAAPCSSGGGWTVECYWGIPDESAEHLLAAEEYIDLPFVLPTFTFHADQIDWPAGPIANDLDTAFSTMGDFLDDYVSDVSDPTALDLPFDHFLLRATGYIDIRLIDSQIEDSPPVWMDFALVTFDGGRVRMEETTIFRTVVPSPPDGFNTENAIVQVPGLYPIEVTYFQKYDPEGVLGAELAGVELLSCHSGGLELPSGDLLPCDFGSATGTPAALIYQADDVMPILQGDFDLDGDIDLLDFGWLQTCYTGPKKDDVLPDGCDTFDSDDDSDVDLIDYAVFESLLGGPLECVLGDEF